MKIRISRLSIHQNAKVFAVLMALGSLVFVLPMFVGLFFAPPGVDARGNPVDSFSPAFALIFPIFYLVFGYITVAIACALYNLISKYLGGFEYEVHDQ